MEGEDWKQKYEDLFELHEATRENEEYLEGELQHIQEEYEAIQGKIEKVQQKYDRLHSDNQDAQSKASQAKERDTRSILSLKAQVEAFEESVAELNVKIRTLEQEKDDLQRSQRILQAELEAQNETLENAVEDQVMLRADVEELEGEKDQLEQEITELNDKNSTLTEEILRLNQEIQTLRERRTSRTASVIKDNIDSNANANANAHANATANEEQQREQQQREKQLAEENEKLSFELNQLRHSLGLLATELERMKEKEKFRERRESSARMGLGMGMGIGFQLPVPMTGLQEPASAALTSSPLRPHHRISPSLPQRSLPRQSVITVELAGEREKDKTENNNNNDDQNQHNNNNNFTSPQQTMSTGFSSPTQLTRLRVASEADGASPSLMPPPTIRRNNNFSSGDVLGLDDTDDYSSVIALIRAPSTRPNFDRAVSRAHRGSRMLMQKDVGYKRQRVASILGRNNNNVGLPPEEGLVALGLPKPNSGDYTKGGFLDKLGSFFGSWRMHYFVVHVAPEGVILEMFMYNSGKGPGGGIGGGGAGEGSIPVSQRLAGIPLSGLEVKAPDAPVDGRNFIITLKPAFSKKVVTLAASSLAERNDWVAELRKHTGQLSSMASSADADGESTAAIEPIGLKVASGFYEGAMDGNRSRNGSEDGGHHVKSSGSDLTINTTAPQLGRNSPVQSPVSTSSQGAANPFSPDANALRSGLVKKRKGTDKKSAKSDVWETFYFVLQRDGTALEWYDADPAARARGALLGTIPLVLSFSGIASGAILTSLPASASHKFIFAITPPLSKKTYTLEVRTLAEKQQWIEDIGYAVDLHVRRDPYSLKEGYLWLKSSEVRGFEEKYVILNNGNLKYCDKGVDTGGQVLVLNKDSLLHPDLKPVLTKEDMVLGKQPEFRAALSQDEMDRGDFRFNVTAKDEDDRVFKVELRTRSFEELNEWVVAIGGEIRRQAHAHGPTDFREKALSKLVKITRKTSTADPGLGLPSGSSRSRASTATANSALSAVAAAAAVSVKQSLEKTLSEGGKMGLLLLRKEGMRGATWKQYMFQIQTSARTLEYFELQSQVFRPQHKKTSLKPSASLSVDVEEDEGEVEKDDPQSPQSLQPSPRGKDLSSSSLSGKVGAITIGNASFLEMDLRYDGRLNVFGIMPAHSSSIYVLQADSTAEKDDWLRVLKSCALKRCHENSIHEGYLSKINSREKWDERYFVLVSNQLLYFKRKHDMKPAGWVFLTSTAVIRPDPSFSIPKKQLMAFSVQTDPTQRKYVMRAKGSLEMDFWINLLKQAMPSSDGSTSPVIPPGSHAAYDKERDDSISSMSRSFSGYDDFNDPVGGTGVKTQLGGSGGFLARARLSSQSPEDLVDSTFKRAQSARDLKTGRSATLRALSPSPTGTSSNNSSRAPSPATKKISFFGRSKNSEDLGTALEEKKSSKWWK